MPKVGHQQRLLIVLCEKAAILTTLIHTIVLIHITILSTTSLPLSPSNYSRCAQGVLMVRVQGGADPDPEIRRRRDFVRQMMNDSWNDYVRWAWGENELKPVSQTFTRNGIFGSGTLGATIVDSLDTLYIMELMKEYEMARDFVASMLNFNISTSVSTFETNIRLLGGLLSAFALTQDVIYKEKALELGERLLPAFNTATGLPYGCVNLQSGTAGCSNAVLSELGSFHLEFAYLSEISGNPIFKEKVSAIRDFMKNVEKTNGLYFNHLDVYRGKFTDDHASLGAGGDSFYEYLLKSSIQSDDPEGRDMYDEAMNAIIRNGLVKNSNRSNLLYIAESRIGVVGDVVEHLACFAGGMFALGAHVDPNNTNAVRDAEIGRRFTDTCHESYIRTQTRLGPERFRFSNALEAEASFDGDKGYLLRPEVIESYFVLYRITGDRRYREWAWDATLAIENYTKVGAGGYSGINNTNLQTPLKDDVQQTFFLAETLKYLYLIFSRNDLIALDQWVMNTECHPLPIKKTNLLYNCSQE